MKTLPVAAVTAVRAVSPTAPSTRIPGNPPARTSPRPRAAYCQTRAHPPPAPPSAAGPSGAGGATPAKPRDTGRHSARPPPMPPTPHLPCVPPRRDEIADIVPASRPGGFDTPLALAGAPPADGSEAPGDF